MRAGTVAAGRMGERIITPKQDGLKLLPTQLLCQLTRRQEHAASGS